MAEESTALRLQLTTEEMVVLFMEATDPQEEIPFSEFLPDYSSDQLEPILDLARRCLIARDLINVDPAGDYSIDQLVLGVVGCSLMADRTIRIMARNSMGEIRALEFQDYENRIFISHTETDQDLHSFGIFSDLASYNQAILASLLLDEIQAVDSPPAQLTETLFNELQEGAGEAVAERLEEASIDKETAEQLAETFSDQFFIKAIQIAEGVEMTSPGEELVFLQGDSNLWSVDPVGEGQIRLEPVSSEAAISQVQSLLDKG